MTKVPSASDLQPGWEFKTHRHFFRLHPASSSSSECIHINGGTSAELGCNQWLFALLLPFYGLQLLCPLWPLTPDNKAFFFQRTAASSNRYFLFFEDHSLQGQEMIVMPWKKSSGDKKLTKYITAASLVANNCVYHVWNHFSPFSTVFWCSVWASAGRRDIFPKLVASEFKFQLQ